MFCNNYNWIGSGWIIFIILIMIISLLLPLLFANIFNKHSYSTPIEIARERYANGDITKEQFEKIVKDLNSIK